MSSPLDHLAYPHILERIIHYADLRALLTLRSLSRRLRDRVDSSLFQHIVLDIQPSGAAVLADPVSGRKLPYIPWDWYDDESLEANLDKRGTGIADTEADSDDEDGNFIPRRPVMAQATATTARDESRARQLSHTRAVDYFNDYNALDNPLDLKWANTLPKLSKLSIVRHRVSRQRTRYGVLDRGAVLLDSATCVDCVDLTPSAMPYGSLRLNVPAFVRRHVLHVGWDGAAGHAAKERLAIRWGTEVRQVVIVFGARESVPLADAGAAIWDVDGFLADEREAQSELGGLTHLLAPLYPALSRHAHVTFVGIETLPPSALGLDSDIPSDLLADALHLAIAAHVQRAYTTETHTPHEDDLRAILGRIEYRRLDEWRHSVLVLETQWPTYVSHPYGEEAKTHEIELVEAESSDQRKRALWIASAVIMLLSLVLQGFSFNGGGGTGRKGVAHKNPGH